jgi:hypothetical protein
VATWDDVQRLALALPEAEEGTLYGRTAYKVRGKAFVWESPHEYGACVVRVDPPERRLLLEANPDAYYVSNHYLGYPMMLVNLDAIRVGELRERVIDAWLLAAPKRLAATLELD